MTERLYNLNFKSCKLESDIDNFPTKSDICDVHTYTHHHNTYAVRLGELIHIGESSNVKKRVEADEKRPNWQNELQEGKKFASIVPLFPDIHIGSAQRR